MKINWKVRLKNRTFLTTFISALILIIQELLPVFGITIKMSNESLLNVVNSILTILAIVGIITDPTTQGVNDSDRAMTYDKPRG